MKNRRCSESCCACIANLVSVFTRFSLSKGSGYHLLIWRTKLLRMGMKKISLVSVVKYQLQFQMKHFLLVKVHRGTPEISIIVVLVGAELWVQLGFTKAGRLQVKTSVLLLAFLGQGIRCMAVTGILGHQTGGMHESGE